MAYRVNYRAAQGQQGAGVTGGGYLLDQIQHNFRAIASGASYSEVVAIIPTADTRDVRVSILGDYEPISVTPTFVIGRVQLSLTASFASLASTSSPLVQLVRNRFEPASAPTSVSQAVIATWDFAAPINTSLPMQPWTVSGSLISNGTLNQGDVLSLNNTPVSATIAVPAGAITIDLLG